MPDVSSAKTIVRVRVRVRVRGRVRVRVPGNVLNRSAGIARKDLDLVDRHVTNVRYHGLLQDLPPCLMSNHPCGRLNPSSP